MAVEVEGLDPTNGLAATETDGEYEAVAMRRFLSAWRPEGAMVHPLGGAGDWRGKYPNWQQRSIAIPARLRDSMNMLARLARPASTGLSARGDSPYHPPAICRLFGVRRVTLDRFPIPSDPAPRLATEPAWPRRVMHVEMGRHLYGGAQQVVHLVTGLAERGTENILVCSEGSEISYCLAAQATRVHQLPIRGELDWTLARSVARLARQENPDLIHLHSRRGADFFGGLGARWGGWPVILSRRVDTPEARWAVPLKYRLFDRVIAISRAIERVLVNCGVPSQKVRCVPSGIDLGPFTKPADRQWVASEFSISTEDPLVGMIAQFIPRKGHHVLLSAVKRLLPRFPRLRVVLFGQGPREPAFRERIAAMNLGEHVRLAGFRRDLDRIVPALDLVVHPALAEGLGVALLQASAAGVPIIGTTAGGIPEIVRHEQNGLLVPPGDVGALADAMGRLLSHPEQRREMGQRGRELASQEFSLDGMV
ncbi:MAG: glycosyltransferase, partial [Pirellulaceae bacterium]|nr:glycosyltransferase [Pirellulaceae bacterium]